MTYELRHDSVQTIFYLQLVPALLTNPTASAVAIYQIRAMLDSVPRASIQFLLSPRNFAPILQTFVQLT